MRTRIFACLLAALLLTPTLASCGNTDEKIGGETTTPVASNTQTETEAAETTLPSGVPEGTTFDGESVSIWYTTNSVSVAETYMNLAGKTPGKLWTMLCIIGTSKQRICWM